MLHVFKDGRSFDQGFFDSIYGDIFGSASNTSLPVDIQEYEDRYELVADIPGVAESDIQVDFKNSTLGIQIKKTRPKDETRKMLTTERAVGTFTRKFSIEVPVDSDNIQAKRFEGVLTITLPKKAEALARKIQIN